MTPQEVRDKLAELDGWTRIPSIDGPPEIWWRNIRRSLVLRNHPIPEGSIDALLPMWPEGWTWDRRDWWWEANRIGFIDGRENYMRVPDTGNFPDDFARLTLAVLQEARK